MGNNGADAEIVAAHRFVNTENNATYAEIAKYSV